MFLKHEICKEAYKPNDKFVVKDDPRGFFYYVRIILFAMGTGLILLIVFYIVYKLKLKKEFKERATEEVDNALSKYYQNNLGYSGNDD